MESPHKISFGLFAKSEPGPCQVSEPFYHRRLVLTWFIRLLQANFQLVHEARRKDPLWWGIFQAHGMAQTQSGWQEKKRRLSTLSISSRPLLLDSTFFLLSPLNPPPFLSSSAFDHTTTSFFLPSLPVLRSSFLLFPIRPLQVPVGNGIFSWRVCWKSKNEQNFPASPNTNESHIATKTKTERQTRRRTQQNSDGRKKEMKASLKQDPYIIPFVIIIDFNVVRYSSSALLVCRLREGKREAYNDNAVILALERVRAIIHIGLRVLQDNAGNRRITAKEEE